MKIDLHVHTSEISGCAHVTGEETVRLYAEAGYDAIVITNHFASYNQRRFERAGFVFFAEYAKAFHLCEEAGQKYGLKVFCGYELRFDQNENDYLVYGLDLETAAREGSNFFQMGPREFSAYAKEHGILFYQAHPFRNHMTVTNPNYLFGIEVRNGNPRHDSRNDIAAAWANRFPHLKKIGGSDFHQREDLAISGIETPKNVETMEDLLEVLKSGEYRVI